MTSCCFKWKPSLTEWHWTLSRTNDLTKSLTRHDYHFLSLLPKSSTLQGTGYQQRAGVVLPLQLLKRFLVHLCLHCQSHIIRVGA